jgi:glycosyltransferase involved in cell wall biosynthesis
MHLCYVLLSKTFGMHQYTADMAHRMAAAGHTVSLVTTTLLPRDRYGPGVEIHTPVTVASTGLSPHSLKRAQYEAAARAIIALRPDVAHFTGPHVWNVGLINRVQAAGIRAVHTLHDLEPHHGRRFGFLLRPWNRMVIERADRILVHGQVYRQRLLAQGVAEDRVVATPLLHLFLGHEMASQVQGRTAEEMEVRYEPRLLFFGRLEAYKGVEYLLTAFAQIVGSAPRRCRLVLAGPGDLSAIWAGNLPPQVELRNRLISDSEALELFQRCSLVLLPYLDATQSALVAAAYYFKKPALVSRSGALPEYVVDGETGFIVEPGHPATLARALVAAVEELQCLKSMGEKGRLWYDQQRELEVARLRTLYRF